MVLENQKEETSWKCRHSWGDNVKYILNEWGVPVYSKLI
jgi:hypothetical protein